MADEACRAIIESAANPAAAACVQRTFAPQALERRRLRHQQFLQQRFERRARRVGQQHVARILVVRLLGERRRSSRARPASRAPAPVAARRPACAPPARPRPGPWPACPAPGARCCSDLDRELQRPAGAAAAPRDAGQQAGQVGRDHRAEQHDHPGDVDPDQQDRHRREGAVQHRIGRHEARGSSPAPAWRSRSPPRRRRRRPRHATTCTWVLGT